MSCPVAPGTALKMEFEDSMVLGEAVYCNGDHGSYLLGVQLDQMLCGLLELRHRLQEFATEGTSGAELTYSVDHRQRQHCQQAQK
jgi:predicted acetyltransferase